MPNASKVHGCTEVIEKVKSLRLGTQYDIGPKTPIKNGCPVRIDSKLNNDGLAGPLAQVDGACVTSRRLDCLIKNLLAIDVHKKIGSGVYDVRGRISGRRVHQSIVKGQMRFQSWKRPRPSEIHTSIGRRICEQGAAERDAAQADVVFYDSILRVLISRGKSIERAAEFGVGKVQ